MKSSSNTSAISGRRSKAFTIEGINDRIPPGGRLTAVRFTHKYVTPKGASYTRIVCRCVCGNYLTVLMASVISGKTVSCGCYHHEVLNRDRHSIDELNKLKPKISRLTATSRAPSYRYPGGQPARMIFVSCTCGNKFKVRQADFIKGHTMSCGCYEMDILLMRNTKFSHTIPKLYACWNDMMRRCYEVKNKGYLYYGAKGVRVCKEWHNYQNFLNWALANGWRPGLQIDKDKKGTGKLYCPKYCCFLTAKENHPSNFKTSK